MGWKIREKAEIVLTESSIFAVLFKEQRLDRYDSSETQTETGNQVS